MPRFTFSMHPEMIDRMSEALLCLAKFDDDVQFEANEAELRISSLNPTKTAYASFIFSRDGFDRYHFSSRSRDPAPASRTWACKLQNRALATILKKRYINGTERQSVLDVATNSCDFELDIRDDLARSRLVWKFNCLSSVVKTYRLTFETAPVLHATFDRTASHNTWIMSSRTLRDVVEYFGPKTEHVDWCMDATGKVTFTSYNDKIQVGSEIIRQPTHTSVQLDDADFDVCRMEKGLHISIPVKDFRSIVTHADSMMANVKASYSSGHRPTQITYSKANITVEFTLMTKGTTSSFECSTQTTPPANLSVRANPQPNATANSRSTSQAGSTRQSRANTPYIVHDEATQDRGPNRSSSRAHPLSRQDSTNQEIASRAKPKQPKGKSLPPSTETTAPPASVNPDSLFFPAPEDDDHQWDPPPEHQDNDMIMWQADNPWVVPPRKPNQGAEFDPEDEAAVTSYNTANTSFASALGSNTNNAMAGRSFEILPTQGPLGALSGMFDEEN